MAKVSAALAALGVKPDDIQTRNLSLNRIDYGPERGASAPTIWSRSSCATWPSVGDAVTAATEAGANLLGGPDLRISDREAASRSAYAAAYRAARDRAEAYAGAAGLKIAPRADHPGRRRRPACPSPMRADGRSDASRAERRAGRPPPPPTPFSPGVTTQQGQRPRRFRA